jgi:hypothetical protein
LLLGHWVNPDGSRSAAVSCFNGTRSTSQTSALYSFMPAALVDAVTGAPFTPQPGATFVVTAYAEVNGQVLESGPVQGIYHVGVTPIAQPLSLGTASPMP